VVVAPIEEHHLACELCLFQQLEQILLSAAGFRKDDCLVLKRRRTLVLLRLARGGEPTPKRSQKNSSLRVPLDRAGEVQELLEVLDLAVHLDELLGRERRAVNGRRVHLVLIPFIRELVELFPIFRQRLRRGFNGRGLALGIL
jgi:hypothetical protein